MADGIEIIDSRDNHHVLTAMVLRDELFNRLVAMGGQVSADGQEGGLDFKRTKTI